MSESKVERSKRATGRTTRLIYDAVARVRGGRHVFLVVADWNQFESLRREYPELPNYSITGMTVAEAEARGIDWMTLRLLNPPPADSFSILSPHDNNKHPHSHTSH